MSREHHNRCAVPKNAAGSVRKQQFFAALLSGLRRESGEQIKQCGVIADLKFNFRTLYYAPK